MSWRSSLLLGLSIWKRLQKIIGSILSYNLKALNTVHLHDHSEFIWKFVKHPGITLKSQLISCSPIAYWTIYFSKTITSKTQHFQVSSAPFMGARVLTVINGWHRVHLCLHLRSSLAFTRRNATNQIIFPSQVYMKFKSLNAPKLAQLPILPPSFGYIVNHIHDTIYTLQAQYTPLPLSNWLGHALAGAWAFKPYHRFGYLKCFQLIYIMFFLSFGCESHTIMIIYPSNPW